MATLTLSSPSLFLLLQLLFLTTGDLLRLTTAAPVDDICHKTKEPVRCVDILKSTDTRTPTAALPVLEGIAIEAATDRAGQMKIKVHNLFLSAKNPNLKRIYGNCENLYRGALDALLIAAQQQRQHAKLVEAAGIVGRAVGGCAAAFGRDAVLKRANADVGVVGDAIAVIAKSMH